MKFHSVQNTLDDVKKNIMLGTIITLQILFASGCRSDLNSFEAGNPDSAGRILIAGEDTEFKRNVFTRILASPEASDWYFNIIGLDQLTEDRAAEYCVLLLTTWYSQGHIDPIRKQLAPFLREYQEKRKVVMLLTTGGDGEIPESANQEVEGINVITSASRTKRVEPCAEGLISLISEKLNQ